MIRNETMQSILARRSYKIFDGRPIDDEALETILTAGQYAPTGMNMQPWHFTVIRSKEMLEKVGAARNALPLPPPVAAAMPADAKIDAMRSAPVLILISASGSPCAPQDCIFAMGNMFIAAASLGIMSGWDHATIVDLFADGKNAELKKELIPEGNTLYAAAFFGYPGPEVKDRGERKSTVQYV